MSASSEIAVSLPVAAGDLLGAVVAGDDVVVAGAAVEDVGAAAAEQAVAAVGAVEDHRDLQRRADRGDVVAVAEVEHDGRDAVLDAVDRVGVVGEEVAARAGAEARAAEAREADRGRRLERRDLVDVTRRGGVDHGRRRRSRRRRWHWRPRGASALAASARSSARLSTAGLLRARRVDRRSTAPGTRRSARPCRCRCARRGRRRRRDRDRRALLELGRAEVRFRRSRREVARRPSASWSLERAAAPCSASDTRAPLGALRMSSVRSA